MAIPKFLQPYLASYDLKRLNKDDPSVYHELITQVLNSGDDKATRWIFRSYPKKIIKDVIRYPKRGVWFKDSLNYWGKILGIKTSPSLNQEAIIKL